MTHIVNTRFGMIAPERTIERERPCWIGRIAMILVFVGWAVFEAKLNGWLHG